MTPFVALAITIAIELPLAMVFIRRDRPQRFFLDVILINLLTNPAANWAAAEGFDFIAIEMVVVLVEWLAYAFVSGLRWRRAALLSLVLNAVSAGAGLIFF